MEAAVVPRRDARGRLHRRQRLLPDHHRDGQGNRLSFDLLAETLDKTNLGDQKPGSVANLERGRSPSNGRLGATSCKATSITTARIIALEPHGQDHRMEIELPRAFARYVAYKGSISDQRHQPHGCGSARGQRRDLAPIPHTMEVTNLHALKAGDRVNVEFDMLAKDLERLTDPTPKASV